MANRTKVTFTARGRRGGGRKVSFFVGGSYKKKEKSKVEVYDLDVFPLEVYYSPSSISEERTFSYYFFDEIEKSFIYGCLILLIGVFTSLVFYNTLNWLYIFSLYVCYLVFLILVAFSRKHFEVEY